MARKKLPAALRTAVWNHYNGKVYEAKCYTGCGEIISAHNFECGHVIAVSKNGPSILSNLRPICPNCNKSISNKNMEEFIEFWGFKKAMSSDDYQCKECEVIFKNKHYLDKHISNSHDDEIETDDEDSEDNDSDSKNNKFQCEKCEAIFKNNFYLNKHINNPQHCSAEYNLKEEIPTNNTKQKRDSTQMNDDTQCHSAKHNLKDEIPKNDTKQKTNDPLRPQEERPQEERHQEGPENTKVFVGIPKGPTQMNDDAQNINFKHEKHPMPNINQTNNYKSKRSNVYCSYGPYCDRKNTTCKKIHNKDLIMKHDPYCSYGLNCKYMNSTCIRIHPNKSHTNMKEKCPSVNETV